MTTANDQIVTLNRQQEYSETDPFTVRRYQQFARHFPRDTRTVLDVGCNIGRGGVTLKAVNPNLRVTGLDCVPERIAALDRTVYEAGICAFAQDIALPSDSFDAIVAGEFIEHLPPDLVFPTLCEFFRLLRLNGVLMLTTPNPFYIRSKLAGTSVLGGAHISQHRPRNLRRRLEDVGYSHVRIRGSGRVSSVVGEWFPILAAYGSYLVRAVKW